MLRHHVQLDLATCRRALHAAGEGGTVRIDVARKGEACAVTVADSGDGVPDEIAERVFEPFVSGREGGTGLGLAVAVAIAEAHGGTIRYRREDDETVFVLSVGEVEVAEDPGH